jgi:ComF family protein
VSAEPKPDSWRAWLRGAGDVVFPPACVHCRGLVEPETSGFRHVCARCASDIDWVRPPACTTCGHPFFGIVSGERTCPHCEGLRPDFDEGRTTVLFKGPVRAWVIELKYHHGLHVLEDMERVIRRSPHVTSFVAGAILVPVPLHPRKRRERTYNQAELLAELFARAAGGGAVVHRMLQRVVDTETQTSFDRRTRMANLKNAFALAPGAALNDRSRYILVDDVFTTGSTLNSCAQVLRAAGALNLGVVTFAHG